MPASSTHMRNLAKMKASGSSFREYSVPVNTRSRKVGHGKSAFKTKKIKGSK